MFIQRLSGVYSVLFPAIRGRMAFESIPVVNEFPELYCVEVETMIDNQQNMIKG